MSMASRNGRFRLAPWTQDREFGFPLILTGTGEGRQQRFVSDTNRKRPRRKVFRGRFRLVPFPPRRAYLTPGRDIAPSSLMLLGPSATNSTPDGENRSMLQQQDSLPIGSRQGSGHAA